jgi:type I restriction enzyme S subunit
MGLYPNFNKKNFKKPNNWSIGPLSDIAEINPQTDVSHLNDDSIITFLPMENVGENGEIIKKERRKFKDVKNGFTCFQEGDVLFAKITPCMENGKGAKVNKLESNVGFGSTEFIILRAKECGDPDFIFQISRSPKFRLEAKRYMRGSAGQLRVPKDLFYKINISLPPLPEQKQIATILTRFDETIAAARANIGTAKALKMRLINELLSIKT